MSKKQTQNAVIAAAPEREMNIPSDLVLDIPEYTNTKSVAIDGSRSRSIGYGVTDATGKDGKTQKWILTHLVIKENGKGKLATLQNTVKRLPIGPAKAYNPYVKDFTSEIAALHACVDCAQAFGGYVLKKETDRVAALKRAGKWDVEGKKTDKKETGKIDPVDFGVTLADKITGKYTGEEKWSCLNSVYSTIIGDNDKLGLVKEIIAVLRRSVAVDYAVVDKIITVAINDIRAAEIATLSQK